ncbi:Adenylate kinase [Methylophaga frappieri]|uniref:Adenylate kinase n=1 Tax=Methylophaga frappieri (strain ATCC BAA-2434 / DSM 25690 / JAM7) TaxID=754477 RepID=I1YHQ8_METFJ|nr:adenylate kinase [Methylophaga frappieri]AFJ02451.1 Adenylate kinase [Methylophaga frappieri]
MRTVLLGAPGSGKGTQGVVLSQQFSIPQISTGDLLRAAVAAGSELGIKAKSAMDAGALVSDDIVIGLIRERLSESDAQQGYILDGFPRNIAQAEALDTMLNELGQPLQGVVLLDVPFEELMQRLTGRRTCKNCGAIFNVHLSPPKTENICDKCGGELFQRQDDNAETISNRLKVYQDQTAPLIGYYQSQQKLHTVQGTGNIDDITQSVSNIFSDI